MRVKRRGWRDNTEASDLQAGQERCKKKVRKKGTFKQVNNIVASCQKHKIWYTSEGWGLKTAVVYWSSGARAWNPHIYRECFHLWTGFCLFCQYREVKTCLQDFVFSCKRQHRHVDMQSESQLCCTALPQSKRPLTSGVHLGVWGGFLQHRSVSACSTGYPPPPAPDGPVMMM